MELSDFGKRFTRSTGALELMDDLGLAMAGDSDVAMLGGGNPGRIPAVREILMKRLAEAASSTQLFDRMFGNYAPPAGEVQFCRALATFLREHQGWDLTERNIALTAGSQFGFFLLFNLLAGKFGERRKKVLLPVTPEYIGYADLGLVDDLFTARKPTIDLLPDQLFKYRVDFDSLSIGDDIGAICVSRPTNPTGNVITDEEVRRLDGLARDRGIPLILDNAYGVPFPGMMFVDAEPHWNQNTITCLSLSKLGLPGIRTGIVIASEAICDAIRACTAVMNLSVSSVGATLLHNLVESGEIVEIGRQHIRPFYEQKAKAAVATIRDAMGGYPCRIHKPEGAMFLWVWFENLPISSAELYRRLKARDVLVISGHHFFPGLEDDWPHREECLRISYAQDPADVERGLKAIAEEVRKAFDERPSRASQGA